MQGNRGRERSSHTWDQYALCNCPVYVSLLLYQAETQVKNARMTIATIILGIGALDTIRAFVMGLFPGMVTEDSFFFRLFFQCVFGMLRMFFYMFVSVMVNSVIN